MKARPSKIIWKYWFFSHFLSVHVRGSCLWKEMYWLMTVVQLIFISDSTKVLLEYPDEDYREACSGHRNSDLLCHFSDFPRFPTSDTKRNELENFFRYHWSCLCTLWVVDTCRFWLANWIWCIILWLTILLYTQTGTVGKHPKKAYKLIVAWFDVSID